MNEYLSIVEAAKFIDEPNLNILVKFWIREGYYFWIDFNEESTKRRVHIDDSLLPSSSNIVEALIHLNEWQEEVFHKINYIEKQLSNGDFSLQKELEINKKHLESIDDIEIYPIS